MTRAYTVAEIDNLRHVVEEKYMWGRYSGWAGETHTTRAGYTVRDKMLTIEEQVRTWMLAGITAQDLLESET